MGALVGIKIQSPALFSWKSTQQARHIRSHFGVKTKLIWKRKYRQGAELATSGNSGKCNWVRIISLITSDQINNNARWETTVATNEYQVTEKLIGVQACLKKQNILLLRVSKHGRGVGMNREGRRLWLAAWGGENRNWTCVCFSNVKAWTKSASPKRRQHGCPWWCQMFLFTLSWA